MISSNRSPSTKPTGGGLWKAASVSLLIAAAPACLPQSTVEVELVGAEFNPLPVADRQGSTGTLGDPVYGPYFDGDSNYEGAPREAVSLLQPQLEQSGQEALVKSDCYWAAAGEEIAVSWEQVLTLSRRPGHLTCESPETVGACRLRSPVDGSPLEISVDEIDDGCRGGPGSTMTVTMTPPADFPFDAFGAPGQDPFRIELGNDLRTPVATLSATTLPDGRDDGDGLCPSINEVSEAAPAPRLSGSNCRADARGLYPSCQHRCGFAAATDGLYTVSIPGTAPDLTLSPVVRVVARAGRTIVRPMSTTDGTTFTWQTATDGSGCHLDAVDGDSPSVESYYECRWHENFSPSLLVAGVRVFARVPAQPSGDLVEHAVAAAGPLVASWKDPPDGGDVTSWTCPIDPSTSGVAIDDLPAACTRRLRATPTYPLDSWANALSNTGVQGAVPLTAPLAWTIELDPTSVPTGAAVFLELRLRPSSGRALMVVDAARDMGRVRTGSSQGDTVQLRNIGTEVARVERVAITGPAAGDFSARVLARPLPRPEVPVEIRRDGDRWIAEVGASAATALVPQLEASRGAFGHRVRLLQGSSVAWRDLVRERDPAPVRAPAARPSLPADVPAAASAPSSASAPAAAGPTARPTSPSLRAATPSGDVADARRALLNLRLPPFVVQPGETVEVFVEMSPSAYGRRSAYLEFEGVDEASPDRAFRVASALYGHGLWGPTLYPFPDGVLEIPYAMTPGSPERSVLLVNSGDMPARRTAVAFTGPDAARFTLLSQHAPTRDIAPGDSELFHLKLANPCLPAAAVRPGAPTAGTTWDAVLEITTDEGPVQIPLLGRPMDCFRHLQPG